MLMYGIMVIAFLVSGSDLDAQSKRAVVKSERKARKAVLKNNKRTAVVARTTKRKRVRRSRVVHYHYRHLPMRGAVLTSLNRAAIGITFNSVGYRFYSGVWYTPKGKSWVVSRAPIGVRIATLPLGYRVCYIGSRTYFYYYGAYYVKSGDEYEVVDTPVGAEIDSLPEGYETVEIDGVDYYKLDGTYYMPSVDDEGDEILVATEI